LARTVRGGRLETRTARLKLAPRPRGYWISTAKPGLHLGYRRLKPAWTKWAYSHDPRAGAPKRKETETPTPERERRRKATLNKVITYLKAALDRAFEHGHIESRSAWSRLHKFKGTDSARIARL
jgi:hypothetical protein